MRTVSQIGHMGQGICYCHPVPIPMTGIIVTGGPTTMINNKPDGRITKLVQGYCGHYGVLITGNPTLITNNTPTVRIGDKFTGCFVGTIVEGHPQTITK